MSSQPDWEHNELMMVHASDARDLAKTIWDYMRVDQQPKKADAIMALGSHDLRVAEWTAKLFLDGYAPLVVVSGASGSITEGKFSASFKKSEAATFADTIAAKGVPRHKILLEDKATNTGENIQFARGLIEERGLKHDTLILVHKPYMERRTYATMKKLWPEQDFVITSAQLPFDEYIGPINPNTDHLQIMVGDLQRLKIYEKKGYLVKQRFRLKSGRLTKH